MKKSGIFVMIILLGFLMLTLVLKIFQVNILIVFFNQIENKDNYFVRENFFGDISFFAKEKNLVNFYGIGKNGVDLRKSYSSNLFWTGDYIRDLDIFGNIIVTVDSGNNLNLWHEEKQNLKNKMGLMFED